MFLRYFVLAVGLGLALAAVLLGAVGTATLSPLVSVPAFTLPSIVVWLIGLLAGACLTWALPWGRPDLKWQDLLLRLGLFVIVIAFGTIMVLAATAPSNSITPVRAALVFILGSLTVAAGWRTRQLLLGDRPIQFDSHWGGLGGGMGGWRISPTAAFAAFTIILSSATVTVALVQPGGKDGTGRPGTTNQASNGVRANETAPAPAPVNAAVNLATGNESAPAANAAGVASAGANRQ